MKVIFNKNLFTYGFPIFKLNNIKNIHVLYSHYLIEVHIRDRLRKLNCMLL